MLPGWTVDELRAEVMLAPRRSVVPVPGLRIITRPGWWQIVTPSFTRGGFNEVALAVLDPAEADAVIARTIAEYRALGIAFRWTVGPDSAPADLGDRLERAGLHAGHGRAMVRGTEPIASPPDITTSIVAADELAAFTGVMAEGWGVDPASLAAANALVLELPTHHLCLARYRGEPAGTASYVLGPRSAFLIGGVVLPAFRRRGVYQALVAARLAHARARGAEVALSHARGETSAPLLSRLGFTSVCDLRVYQSEAT